jgi:hypothetical protein
MPYRMYPCRRSLCAHSSTSLTLINPVWPGLCGN